MPNWCYNTLTILGSAPEINKMKKKIRSKHSEFDFNRILPLPKALALEAGSVTGEALLVFRTKKLTEVTPEDEKNWLYERISQKTDEELEKLYRLGKKYNSNLKKYGAAHWYDWCRINWGVKWNAADAEYAGENILNFSTPWNPPVQLLSALSKQFPKLAFILNYTGETYGEMNGIIFFSNGDNRAYEPEDGTEESYRLHAQLEFDGDLEAMAEEMRELFGENSEAIPKFLREHLPDSSDEVPSAENEQPVTAFGEENR